MFPAIYKNEVVKMFIGSDGLIGRLVKDLDCTYRTSSINIFVNIDNRDIVHYFNTMTIMANIVVFQYIS